MRHYTWIQSSLLALCVLTLCTLGCEEAPPPKQEVITLVGTLRRVECQNAIIELRNPADTIWGGGRGFLIDSCGIDPLGKIITCNSPSFPAITAALCNTCLPPPGSMAETLVTIEVPLDTNSRWPCPPIACPAVLPRFSLIRSAGVRRVGQPKAICGVRID